jgi:hypothetical protein
LPSSELASRSFGADFFASDSFVSGFFAAGAFASAGPNVSNLVAVPPAKTNTARAAHRFVRDVDDENWFRPQLAGESKVLRRLRIGHRFLHSVAALIFAGLGVAFSCAAGAGAAVHRDVDPDPVRRVSDCFVRPAFHNARGAVFKIESDIISHGLLLGIRTDYVC